ncbi:MAG TPA: S53 family peptidase [Pseudonocardiaceae bacterium]|nr:S53 family peptidase [Pseudonocardiaceae bacterium]
MKHTRLAGVLAGAVALVVAVLPSLPASASPSNVRDVCGAAAPGYARCLAEVRTDISTHTLTAHALPAGYGPADLRAAYELPATGGANQTVAIVDAGDDATAEADLGVYRTTYGLPACTTADGCFRKVDEQGKAGPLPTNQGWGIEISLDLDMVSSACPACHILLVEGDSASFDDLGTSENTAVALGANEVSNSYGGTEFNGSNAYAADYTHAGVAIVASSGDGAYGPANTPAAYQSVIAVGGTSLTKASNARGWSETAWVGASSGCSAWVDKPTWQSDPNCPGRMVADVAADADPNTGPAVYDAFDGYKWLVVGGTSASSPFIAGVIALAGNPGQYPNASYFYAHAAQLNDVTSGNNSGSEDCGGDYQCNAGPGYDGPTGNGTPNGIAAF